MSIKTRSLIINFRMDFQRPLSVLLFVLLPVMIFGQLLIPYLGTNGQYGYADIKGSRIVQPVMEKPLYLTTEQPLSFPNTTNY